MLKKMIIEALKQGKQGTIGFNGLLNVDAVSEERQKIFDQYSKEANRINAENPEANLTIKIVSDGNKQKIVCSNGQTVLLPFMPRTGKIVVRSKDYTIDGVYCDFASILTDTFEQYSTYCKFNTKAGSTIQIEN